MLAKRLVDLVGAAVGLILLAPLLVAVALVVLIVDGRPVFFRQTRVGRHERPFTIVKFRTMVPDADRLVAQLAADNEREGPLFKVSNDPRVTRLGAVLRSTCLDELPQLLNVLAGHMSLVGPRPALPSEVRRFDAALRRRHEVRPGITGPWQVLAEDMNCFETYRRLDLDYVDRRTFRGDMDLLWRTGSSVVRRLGATIRTAAEPSGEPAPALDHGGDNVIVLLPDGGFESHRVGYADPTAPAGLGGSASRAS